jgi:hypothetical protein
LPTLGGGSESRPSIWAIRRETEDAHANLYDTENM